MFVSKHLSLLSIPVLVLAGCASPLDEEVSEESLGTTRAELGLSTCAIAPVAATLDMNLAYPREVMSSNGYEHASDQCLGDFLVRVKNPYASSFDLYARYSGPVPTDSYRCTHSRVEMTPFYYVYNPTVGEFTWTKGATITVNGKSGIFYDPKAGRYEERCTFAPATVSVTRSAQFPIYDVRIAANAVHASESFWAPAVFVPVTVGFRR